MTIPADLSDPFAWPVIREKIAAERAERVEGLLHATPEGLRGDQQFIAALDWVVEQSQPPKQDNEEAIYDD
jgi:hypothetical protein